MSSSNFEAKFASGDVVFAQIRRASEVESSEKEMEKKKIERMEKTYMKY